MSIITISVHLILGMSSTISTLLKRIASTFGLEHSPWLIMFSNFVFYVLVLVLMMFSIVLVNGGNSYLTPKESLVISDWLSAAAIMWIRVWKPLLTCMNVRVFKFWYKNIFSFLFISMSGICSTTFSLLKYWRAKIKDHKFKGDN